MYLFSRRRLASRQVLPQRWWKRLANKGRWSPRHAVPPPPGPSEWTGPTTALASAICLPSWTAAQNLPHPPSDCICPLQTYPEHKQLQTWSRAAPHWSRQSLRNDSVERPPPPPLRLTARSTSTRAYMATTCMVPAFSEPAHSSGIRAPARRAEVGTCCVAGSQRGDSVKQQVRAVAMVEELWSQIPYQVVTHVGQVTARLVPTRSLMARGQQHPRPNDGGVSSPWLSGGRPKYARPTDPDGKSASLETPMLSPVSGRNFSKGTQRATQSVC